MDSFYFTVINVMQQEEKQKKKEEKEKAKTLRKNKKKGIDNSGKICRMQNNNACAGNTEVEAATQPVLAAPPVFSAPVISHKESDAMTPRYGNAVPPRFRIPICIFNNL